MTYRIRVENLHVRYPVRGGVFRRTVGCVEAVGGVSLQIQVGGTFGLVGESGCGKSSLSRAILCLQDAASGQILFAPEGSGAAVDIARMSEAELRPLRAQMQIVFQDPQSSLNPRLRIGTILAESLRALVPVSAQEIRARVDDSLAAVGLPADAGRRFAHEFSGGQRQRVAIARALISRPSFLVLDEPVSALDVSVRAQILNLLADLRASRGLTYLFVSHDLSVIRHMCDQVGVMYLGKLVEVGPVDRIFEAPAHPYTRSLLAAIPNPDPRAKRAPVALNGDPPSPIDLPKGCAYASRCPIASGLCHSLEPVLRDMDGAHRASCHHATLG
ncbi:MAG: ATP-binding cassette domain-containing protein [Tagaea sp.]|nr:ATP-binding cassette domain-containing protein [Tagaea sp.]